MAHIVETVDAAEPCDVSVHLAADRGSSVEVWVAVPGAFAAVHVDDTGAPYSHPEAGFIAAAKEAHISHDMPTFKLESPGPMGAFAAIMTAAGHGPNGAPYSVRFLPKEYGRTEIDVLGGSRKVIEFTVDVDGVIVSDHVKFARDFHGYRAALLAESQP